MLENRSNFVTPLLRGDRDEDQKVSKGVVSVPEDEKSSVSLNPILCKSCGAIITFHEEKKVVNGTHNHTFFNPAGIVFELGCFANAQGCRVTGQPTDEFTWFHGFVWLFALCSQCKAHLGWQFRGADSSFFGLILKELHQ